MNNEEIVWEEPPEPYARRGGPRKDFWLNHLQPLMERPNEWARVMTYPGRTTAHSAARELREGIRRHPPGRWNFVGASIPEGSGLWARYLGPEEDVTRLDERRRA